jgi:hypothetical protein
VTYRDDLEAATERADALQREVDELREQNSKLKADARSSESLDLDRGHIGKPLDPDDPGDVPDGRERRPPRRKPMPGAWQFRQRRSAWHAVMLTGMFGAGCGLVVGDYVYGVIGLAVMILGGFMIWWYSAPPRLGGAAAASGE